MEPATTSFLSPSSPPAYYQGCLRAHLQLLQQTRRRPLHCRCDAVLSTVARVIRNAQACVEHTEAKAVACAWWKAATDESKPKACADFMAVGRSVGWMGARRPPRVEDCVERTVGAKGSSALSRLRAQGTGEQPLQDPRREGEVSGA